MTKNTLTLRLSEDQVERLDKSKEFLKEKTYSKTIDRIVENFVKANGL